MTVVRLEPDENGATSNWNAEGAKAKWEEVAQAAMQQGKRLKDGSTEEEAQTLKKPTEAEAKARGVKVTTTNSVVVQQFRVSAAQVEAKITVGSVIKRIAWRVFEKPVSTQVTNTLEVGNWSQEQFMSGTVEAFQNFLALKERIEETTRAKLIEKCQVALATPGTGTGESRASVVYLEVEYEAGGEAVVGKAAGAMLLIGSAVATLRAVVKGTATGALLLTGTSTGTVRSVVAAKATGTLTLTGASKATLAEVISGKATGAFLLTGTAAGTLRSNVAGKATGHMLLTGSGKASRPAKETKRALILIFDE